MPNRSFDEHGHVWPLQMARYANELLARKTMAQIRDHVITCAICRHNSVICLSKIRQIQRFRTNQLSPRDRMIVYAQMFAWVARSKHQGLPSPCS